MAAKGAAIVTFAPAAMVIGTAAVLVGTLAKDALSPLAENYRKNRDRFSGASAAAAAPAPTDGGAVAAAGAATRPPGGAAPVVTAPPTPVAAAHDAGGKSAPESGGPSAEKVPGTFASAAGSAGGGAGSNHNDSDEDDQEMHAPENSKSPVHSLAGGGQGNDAGVSQLSPSVNGSPIGSRKDNYTINDYFSADDDNMAHTIYGNLSKSDQQKIDVRESYVDIFEHNNLGSRKTIGSWLRQDISLRGDEFEMAQLYLDQWKKEDGKPNSSSSSSSSSLSGSSGSSGSSSLSGSSGSSSKSKPLSPQGKHDRGDKEKK